MIRQRERFARWFATDLERLVRRAQHLGLTEQATTWLEAGSDREVELGTLAARASRGG